MTLLSNFHEKLKTHYADFKQANIGFRRIRHSDIESLISARKSNSLWTIREEGLSLENRIIYSLQIGTGKTRVLLWSQMHGNESTATRALFDMFNFLESDIFETEKNKILSECTLIFVPMLNPDGAERFQRRNAAEIDINRDALKLSVPESQILHRLVKTFKPDFGFNLHDQDPYYAVDPKNMPAAMSFLSPAFDSSKNIDESRKKGMQVIVLMTELLKKDIPKQIGKYSDAFMPSAFGDHIQSTGTSTILIESGNTFDDLEKEKIRELNFTAILSALLAISSTTYKSINYEAYQKIPFNKKDQLFDAIFLNARIEIASKTVTFDIGVRREFQKGKDLYIISDIGDLSQKSAYKTIDLQGKIIEERIRPATCADFLTKLIS